MKVWSAALIVAIALLLTNCGRKRKITTPVTPQIGSTETGIASWYGHPYHGRAAANGEIYDMEKMTAAHRTLPFNTWVRVMNLANQKTVEVRIIDRGPFVDGRIIDLSHAAAQVIDLIGPGIAQVRLEIIAPPKEPAVENLFGVQVGAFRDRGSADVLRQSLEQKFGAAIVVRRPGSPNLWRVVVGRLTTMEAADDMATQLRPEFPDPFVVRLDQPDDLK